MSTMDPSVQAKTHCIPFSSPPTPSPSPGPFMEHQFTLNPTSHPTLERQRYLRSVLRSCTPAELLFISQTIAPLLKRDFLSSTPPELAIHILGFIDDPRTLMRAGMVSHAWKDLASEEYVWKGMCAFYGFGGGSGTIGFKGTDEEPREELEEFADIPRMPRKRKLRKGFKESDYGQIPPFSYRHYFKESYITILNWRHGGRLLRLHCLPMLSAAAQQRAITHPPASFFPTTFPDLHASPGNLNPPPATAPNPPLQSQDSGVVTSLALDDEWVVVGLASSRIHVFSARTGVLARTLVGHDSGVWGVCLVSRSYKAAEKGKAKATGVEESFQGMSIGSSTNLSREMEGQGLSHNLPFVLRVALGLDPTVRRVGRKGVVDEAAEENMLLDPSTVRPHDPLKRPSSAPNSLPSIQVPRLPPSPSSHSGAHQARPSRAATKPYTPERQSDPCFASEGWGQPNALVVSGGCDKVVRVWDVKSGHCIYTLPGHTSTIRCMRTLHRRPIAVTGSRDGTVRVWDVQRGRAEKSLLGHMGSVRCIDVNGNRAVSGSYDTTCRIWDVDTGECIHVLRGHFHQVYSVAFDGVRVASGGLDTTVRMWDAESGTCLALLQGHTALVCQIQLSREHQLLATGGADGRVITFSLDSSGAGNALTGDDPLSRALEDSLPSSSSFTPPQAAAAAVSVPVPPLAHNPPRQHAAYEPLHRIAAHDSSVTALQFNGRFLVTGGNDGRVRLWETETGRYVRELTEGGECVWKVGFTGGGEAAGVEKTCAIMAKRSGKTVMEVWSFRPE